MIILYKIIQFRVFNNFSHRLKIFLFSLENENTCDIYIIVCVNFTFYIISGELLKLRLKEMIYGKICMEEKQFYLLKTYSQKFYGLLYFDGLMRSYCLNPPKSF